MNIRFLLIILLAGLALSGCRFLTANEKNFTSKIYSGQLNANKVQVYSLAHSRQNTNDKLMGTLEAEYRTDKSVKSYGLDKSQLLTKAAASLRNKSNAMVIKNNIYYKSDAYKADLAAGFPTNVFVDDLDLLGHEIMHVWQYQNRDRTGYSLLAVALEHIRYSDPYDYHIVPGKKFLDYRFEQQGRIVQDYVRYSFTAPGSAELQALRRLLSQEFDLKAFNETLLASAG